MKAMPIRNPKKTTIPSAAHGNAFVDCILSLDSIVQAGENGGERRSGTSAFAAVGRGKKGKFLTAVCNLETAEPLWFGKERKRQTLDKFFRTQLRIGQRQRIEAACVDMWEPFRLSIEEWAPRCKIVYDKFHIVQHANGSQACGHLRSPDLGWSEREAPSKGVSESDAPPVSQLNAGIRLPDYTFVKITAIQGPTTETSPIPKRLVPLVQMRGDYARHRTKHHARRTPESRRAARTCGARPPHCGRT
jgi:hypothetical protein